MRKGFLHAAFKKTIVSMDNRLAGKLEQYVGEETDRLNNGKEGGFLDRIKFAGVFILKAPVEALRNRRGF